MSQYRTMSDEEYRAHNDKIEKALEIAERAMLEDKARRGENVIVSIDGEIRSVPASEYL